MCVSLPVCLVQAKVTISVANQFTVNMDIVFVLPTLSELDKKGCLYFIKNNHQLKSTVSRASLIEKGPTFCLFFKDWVPQTAKNRLNSI